MTFNPDNPNEHAEAMAYDPYAAAAGAEIQTRPIYGELDIEAYPAIFEKGKGKVRLDPKDVGNYERWQVRTIVDMRIFPIADTRNGRPIDRNVCANGDYDTNTKRTFYSWIKIVRPSLDALVGHRIGQADILALNGKHVKAELVPDGRKYRNKDGDELDSTILRFLAIYANEAECRAAYYADSGREAPDADGSEPIPGFEPAAAATQVKPATAITRESARMFLAAIIKDSGSDMGQLTGKLQMMPMITEHFPLGSDELQAAISEIIAA